MLEFKLELLLVDTFNVLELDYELYVLYYVEFDVNVLEEEEGMTGDVSMFLKDVWD